MHQDCKDCPLYRESLAGKFAEAMRAGIIELSGVGSAWDDPLMRRGAQAIVYQGDAHAAEFADDAETALDLAMAKIRDRKG